MMSGNEASRAQAIFNQFSEPFDELMREMPDEVIDAFLFKIAECTIPGGGGDTRSRLIEWLGMHPSLSIYLVMALGRVVSGERMRRINEQTECE